MRTDVTLAAVLQRFPKSRASLPLEYQEIYQRIYAYSREGKSWAAKASLWLEGWMHRKVAKPPPIPLLEVGAGTLNHVKFEAASGDYDVVEPQAYLYENAGLSRNRIRHFYDSVADVPAEASYARVASIAVLEHIPNLPPVLARMALLTRQDGVLVTGIPSEGAFAWQTAWQYGTGPAFKKRFGLDFGTFQRFEHVNNAAEIELLTRHLFDQVEVRRFPLPLFHLSVYTVLVARGPRHGIAQQLLGPAEVVT